MIYEMRLNPAPFEKMKGGQKSVELRLYDKKRQLLKKGDVLQFVQTESGEILQREIVGLEHFSDFFELYEHFSKDEIGYSSNDKAKPEDMYAYYSKKEIEENGVLAIVLKG